MFPYVGGNHRYAVGDREGGSVAEFKAKYPFLELAPFFTSWEDLYEEARSAMRLPGTGWCKAGRLAHVEPADRRGEFTTHPLVAEGNRLVVNGRAERGGSIRVEVQDPLAVSLLRGEFEDGDRGTM